MTLLSYCLYIFIRPQHFNMTFGEATEHLNRRNVDCKTVGFFLKISKEIGNAWRKSLMRSNRASLLFDCSRVLEYAKIRTVLQSIAATETLQSW